MSKLVTILNGPNLNLLGKREPEIYGHATLNDVEVDCTKVAAEFGLTCELKQSNIEGELVNMIQACRETSVGIIINPAAFTHTSVALRDALLSVNIPFVEVHLSNVHARESFRQHSYLSDIAVGVISGLGTSGYEYALDFARDWLTQNK